MKRLIITIGAILFLATMVDSFINAIQRGRSRPGSIRRTRGRGRYSPSQRRSFQSALARKALQKKTSTQSTTTAQTTKTPSTPKPAEQVAAAEKKVEEKTKELKTAVNKVENAKTPAEKEVAIKTAQQRAQELIASMKTIDRTYSGDLRGYEQKDIDLATNQIEQLKKEQDVVKKEVETKEKELAQVTEPGSVWTLWQASPKTGKEADYNRLRVEISNLNSTWGGLEKEIQARQVITGGTWSNAYRTLVGAGVALVAAGAADIALTSGENIGAVASSVKDLSGQVASAGWEAVKSGASNPMKLIGGALAISGLVSNVRWGIGLVTGAAQIAKAVYNGLKDNPNADPVAVQAAKTEVEELQKLKALLKQYSQLEMQSTKDPKIAEQLEKLKGEIEPLAVKYKAQLQKAQAQIAAQQKIVVQKAQQK